MIDQLKYDIAINRSEKAFRTLFMKFHGSLLRFCSIYINDKSLSEEIISDVMLNLWLKNEQLMEVIDLKVYLFKSVKNRALNYLTKVRKYTHWDIDNIPISHNVDNYSPEFISIEKEFHKKIISHIESLPPQCQLVFKLIREYGLPYKQVADILGLSEKTVDRHLQIAMQKLSEVLKNKIQK
ncbi:RNA polymerase sigma-70 factor [Rhizosphaericola mali]|uniref:RNA polymerase sigma-70 factor n=1 Tax=Rhizosphaericola mali TaxID=2545455 RepID=UPI00177C13C1|nr:RNA polymerase sigma-70 factor [Rhizosphaericola mali]